jgi:hypothetical protein
MKKMEQRDSTMVWPWREAHGSIAVTTGKEDGVQPIPVVNGDAGWLK